MESNTLNHWKAVQAAKAEKQRNDYNAYLKMEQEKPVVKGPQTEAEIDAMINQLLADLGLD